MSKQAAAASGGGIGFCGALAIVFIALKLAEVGVVATWTWTWVLSPLWIPWAIFFAVIAVFGLFAVMAAIISK